MQKKLQKKGSQALISMQNPLVSVSLKSILTILRYHACLTIYLLHLQIIYNFFLTIKNMSKPNSSNDKLIFHKIHFTIRKRVKFGQAVYACGSTPQFGCWNPQRAFRLKWNEGHLWTGIVLFTNHIPEDIQYKYVVANWDNPSSRNCEWELGQHNRRTDLNRLKPTTVCDDKWNIDRIILILMANKSRSHQDERFYVTGDIRELGQWRQKKTMKKNLNSIISSQIKNQPQIITESTIQQYELWTYSFQIFRTKSRFHYYYIKKGSIWQSQRKPGRVFQFKKGSNIYPYRKKVSHTIGDFVIFDEINLNQIHISKITQYIFVGSCLKSSLDIQKIKQQNITSILSIQSEKDFKKNGVSPHYLQLLCKENQIKYRKYAIEDMNNKDFISKAEGCVAILAQLLHSGQTIYVHCSAGIYRSPQMIALYLAAFQHYKVQDAVTLLQEKHPYARPNHKVVEEALTLINNKKAIKIRV